MELSVENICTRTGVLETGAWNLSVAFNDGRKFLRQIVCFFGNVLAALRTTEIFSAAILSDSHCIQDVP